jgi:hypothetical protein
MRFSTMKRSAAVSLFLAVALLGSGAHATPGFPGAVQDHLGLTCMPDCILCHRTTAGGGGAELDKAFAQTLRDDAPAASRLYPYDPLSVPPALDWAEETGLDADGDGTPDIDELRDGVYPATDQRFCGEGAVEGPTYGCGARIAPRGSIDGTAAGLAALVALALARLGRRSRRR